MLTICSIKFINFVRLNSTKMLAQLHKQPQQSQLMKHFAIGLLMLAGTAAAAQASDFFSTEPAEEFITYGARIGVNTANRTLSSDAFPACYHNESWGTGFDLGGVVNFNFLDCVSVQPGLFFESRSGRNVIMGTASGSGLHDDGSEIAQAGKHNSYSLVIPVVGVAHFNVADEVRWNLDFGPYVAFTLGSSMKNKRYIIDGDATQALFRQKPAGADFGFKFGTSIDILNHYNIGVHYMAGCTRAWQNRELENLTKSYGGHTKAWVFTVGYNF